MEEVEKDWGVGGGAYALQTLKEYFTNKKLAIVFGYYDEQFKVACTCLKGLIFSHSSDAFFKVKSFWLRYFSN